MGTQPRYMHMYMKLLRDRTWLVLGTRPPPEVFQASAKLPSIPKGESMPRTYMALMILIPLFMNRASLDYVLLENP